LTDPEARYYEPIAPPASDGGKTVRCTLCPHLCRIKPGQAGTCGVRKNDEGVLRSLISGRVSAVHLDPIEKKPLYHFHPGRPILSVGAIGCNLRCRFCQNWELVEGKGIRLHEIGPEELAEQAKKSGSIGIAFTYNEPTIWFEYIIDTARVFRREGLKTILVTNGYCNPDPWSEMLLNVDAMNIDLKSIRDGFYRKYCSGSVEPVKKCIRLAVEKCHVEITNLIIPRHNDSVADIGDLVDFVADLGKGVPLHFSRYHPCHQFHEPPTPAETLFTAFELAKSRLDYVYIGNLMTEEGQNTCCPQCGGMLIQRSGYRTQVTGLSRNRCRRCGREIEVVV